MDHVLPAHHEYEVTQDWHRPAGDDSEWRVLVCACGHVQREGREPTSLPTEPALGPT